MCSICDTSGDHWQLQVEDAILRKDSSQHSCKGTGKGMAKTTLRVGLKLVPWNWGLVKRGESVFWYLVFFGVVKRFQVQDSPLHLEKHSVKLTFGRTKDEARRSLSCLPNSSSKVNQVKQEMLGRGCEDRQPEPRGLKWRRKGGQEAWSWSPGTRDCVLTPYIR